MRIPPSVVSSVTIRLPSWFELSNLSASSTALPSGPADTTGSRSALAEWEDEWTPEDEGEFTEMVSTEMTLTKAVVLGMSILDQELPHSIVYPLFHISALGLKLHLRPPLTVAVDDSDEGVIVDNPQLRIWGTGSNKYEALEDFSRTFVEVLRSYEETPEQEMTSDALEYRRLLQSYIRRRENV